VKSTETVSILLVDDEPLFRQGLRTLLQLWSNEQRPAWAVVGEAESAEEALVTTGRLGPSLVLLDLQLAHSNGMAVLVRLQELPGRSKVLVLSSHQEDERIFQAMQAGASGYVFKSRLATQLYQAIATVMAGEIYLPPDVATRFFRLFQEQAKHVARVCRQVRLTEREHEVLSWLVQGASNDEIARHLYVTVATVKAHLTAIFEKLQVSSRAQAIVAALKMGLTHT
jgi:DNA-binding NarL/FixJ family response regulator